jgi:hypothetical protein
MWIYIERENTGLNLDHVVKLFVEVTGSGAALKAEMSGGKTLMVGYYPDKPSATDALARILGQQESGAALVRLGPEG